jgi:hypothetical protein
MKNNLSVSLLVVVLVSLVVALAGCSGFFGHPGQTAAEVHRDQMRSIKVNQNEMMSDIDRSLDLDRPSRLTERKVP